MKRKGKRKWKQDETPGAGEAKDFTFPRDLFDGGHLNKKLEEVFWPEEPHPRCVKTNAAYRPRTPATSGTSGGSGSSRGRLALPPAAGRTTVWHAAKARRCQSRRPVFAPPLHPPRAINHTARRERAPAPFARVS